MYTGAPVPGGHTPLPSAPLPGCSKSEVCGIVIGEALRKIPLRIRILPHPPGCAFIRYAEHTHPPSPGSQTPGTIRPHILLRPHRGRIHPSHKPICAHLRFFFVRALLSQHPSVSMSICLRAQSFCVHRGSRARRAHASERRMCITVGASPVG